MRIELDVKWISKLETLQEVSRLLRPCDRIKRTTESGESNTYAEEVSKYGVHAVSCLTLDLTRVMRSPMATKNDRT